MKKILPHVILTIIALGLIYARISVDDLTDDTLMYEQFDRSIEKKKQLKENSNNESWKKDLQLDIQDISTNMENHIEMEKQISKISLILDVSIGLCLLVMFLNAPRHKK